MEKCYTFKGQNLESRLPCIFQAIGNILHSKQKQLNTEGKVNENIYYGARFVLPYYNSHPTETHEIRAFRIGPQHVAF